jgi:hypothetical protein
MKDQLNNAKLIMHRHLKESINISVKSTLTITDIRYIKNNLYRVILLMI